MRVIDLDLRKWVILLLPTFLRGKRLVSFLHALIAPLVGLYDAFCTNRKDNLYRLRHTGQVCYLRKVLNDAFMTDGFEIVDQEVFGDWVIVYKEEFEKWVIVYEEAGERAEDNPEAKPNGDNLIVYTVVVIETKVGTFFVRIPAGVCVISDTDSNYNKIKKIVNQYKMVSCSPEYKLKT